MVFNFPWRPFPQSFFFTLRECGLFPVSVSSFAICAHASCTRAFLTTPGWQELHEKLQNAGFFDSASPLQQSAVTHWHATSASNRKELGDSGDPFNTFRDEHMRVPGMQREVY